MRAANDYARPDLLAEPDWLWEHHRDPGMRLIDCTRECFDRAHIPGAVPLLSEETEGLIADGVWLKDPADPLHVIGPDGMTMLMRKLGVSDDSSVVVYDAYNGSWATRLWWVLTYYGHPNVRVLNGGWQRWVDEGRPVSIRLTEPGPGDFTPHPNEALRVRLDEMKKRHSDADVQVVNALWQEWYEGTENDYETKHVGHIPGSVNVPIERFLAEGDVPTLRSSEEIARVFADAGLDREKETIVHCYAGVRTTMGVFAMSLLGWDRVRAYDASMAEWANRDDTPLVTGPAG